MTQHPANIQTHQHIVVLIKISSFNDDNNRQQKIQRQQPVDESLHKLI